MKLASPTYLRYSTMIAALCLPLPASRAEAPKVQRRYYAYPAVEDRHGVIAPWYTAQNGQCDFRVRIAAETLKRYPWTDATKAVAAVPEYVFNGHWQIAPDGAISVPPIEDWANGDLGQRAAYVLSALVDYYRYSGDPAAVAHMTLQADALLDHCLTPPDHPWPNFLISVPTRGKVYGKCDPSGMIQLDIVAEVGLALVRCHQVTGNDRWLRDATHWAELLAEKRCRDPHQPPWNRYANPEAPRWSEDQQTGGIAFLLEFFDALIRLGVTGKGNCIIEARQAAQAYLRENLLPRWTVNDVWGRNYWDWPDPVQAENVTEFVVRYLMDHPEDFPNWRCDARNVLSLFLNHTSVSPASGGDVHSGAWAYPESSGCCGRSLWYGPMELAMVFAQYGLAAGSEWGREMARRQILMATYDCHETGVVEDNIDGGQIVAGAWFKIAHPMALKHVLGAMAWLPDVLGANRENHVMRSSAVIRSVVYGKGKIAYATFDAPRNTVDVVRVAFAPATIKADGKPLPLRADLNANGYTVRDLPGGDVILTIRHDGSRNIVIEGADPQEAAENDALGYVGSWTKVEDPDASGGAVHVASQPRAAMTFPFVGNQVRLIGNVGPDGGLAEVRLDGVKQLVGIDCWNPSVRHQQVLYYRNGLAGGKHILEVLVRGAKNPVSKGTRVAIDAVQWSAATGDSGFGEGGGPTQAQRILFGYTGRNDYKDADGNDWRPATEFVTRTGHMTDSVATAWVTKRRRIHIASTPDPELYRYGAHGTDFTVYVTVGPGLYHARLKFAETTNVKPDQRAITSIAINGKQVTKDMDITATAGGVNKAVDLVFNEIKPEHGVIAIRFTGHEGKAAMVQALEVGPGHGGQGATPVCLEPRVVKTDGNLLANPGFEEGVAGEVGSLGKAGGGHGWKYLFAGPSQSYIWAESAYSKHPEWGRPVLHAGKEAIRTHTDGRGHTVVYQDVEVLPDTRYTASAWVRADDLHGKGFGANAGDSAGLWIQELDSKGKCVADHPKQAVTAPGDYKKLGITFTSGKTTKRLRFLLDTTIVGPYDQGHVTYDDCALTSQQHAPQ
ncbi:MAG: hypothetical protein JXQ73_28120 [Phycisphaerae bacterium]|nr:hypothetical protein [Phycisphaerae bacterium]